MENNNEEEKESNGIKPNVVTNDDTPLNQSTRVLDKQQLALFILRKTEEQVDERGSDKSLDRELQKIELLNGMSSFQGNKGNY
jgi:hypothetical protein